MIHTGAKSSRNRLASPAPRQLRASACCLSHCCVALQTSRSWMPFPHGKRHHRISLHNSGSQEGTLHTHFRRNVVLGRHKHPSTRMAPPPLAPPPHQARCFRVPFKAMLFVLELQKYTFWGVSLTQQHTSCQDSCSWPT